MIARWGASLCYPIRYPKISDAALSPAKHLFLLVPQEGFRTPDPVITNDVLYRLSYCGGTGAMSGLQYRLQEPFASQGRGATGARTPNGGLGSAAGNGIT